MNSLRSRSSAALALLAAIALAVFWVDRAAASAPALSPQERNWEVQVGQRAYTTYLERGEIIPRQSQLYAILDPVANPIALVANRQYYAPFQFILLNEPEPNAFSMPGGYVFVTTAMLSYLRNRDELAGVICHEVNHDIHHDMYNVYQSTQRGAETIAYERAAEVRADAAGAYTCAKAGFNPWGMVWNMRLHRGMGQSEQIAASEDHPSDDQRLADLVALLTRDTAAFGKFRDDVAASVPLQNHRVFVQPGQDEYAPQYPQQYPQQYPPQYPMQYPSQYPSQYPPPPPPLPACYPGCSDRLR